MLGKMHSTRVLIVDDDPAVIKLLRATFEGRDYKVAVATDGAEALLCMESKLPDLVILDIMMPEVDGFEVCRRLRQWSQVPVIMLSGRCTTEDKVSCLEAGADDYICKPFDVDELMARVEAVLRRARKVGGVPGRPIFTAGDLEINFSARQVILGGNEVRLTPTEYNLLEELVFNAGRVLTHSHLLQKIWGDEYGGETEYLRVFVSRLRIKLEPEPAEPKCIVTVPGVGYMFDRRAADRT
jgi:two-component system KDP operon response regulator KdpE